MRTIFLRGIRTNAEAICGQITDDKGSVAVIFSKVGKIRDMVVPRQLLVKASEEHVQRMFKED
eukprot:scaffold133765_cov60-Attheya_sp.AAC.1